MNTEHEIDIVHERSRSGYWRHASPFVLTVKARITHDFCNKLSTECGIINSIETPKVRTAYLTRLLVFDTSYPPEWRHVHEF